MHVGAFPLNVTKLVSTGKTIASLVEPPGIKRFFNIIVKEYVASAPTITYDVIEGVIERKLKLDGVTEAYDAMALQVSIS